MYASDLELSNNGLDYPALSIHITMVMNDITCQLSRIGYWIIDKLPICIVIVILGKSTIQIMLGLYWHGW